MPRRKSAVKIKHAKTGRSAPPSIESWGAVDLHFHGAFGIDLMHAAPEDLDRLSALLWKSGVAAFCPTTLSVRPGELKQAVERIGRWIRHSTHTGALPLGIHLEGPFIHPASCGAHPPGSIRPLEMTELENLWNASLKTLKILTLAPELLSPSRLRALRQWARSRKIILSLGHSQATEDQSRIAFDQGVQGVTHAWNALPFHHRKPGPLGAALGRKNVHVELIVDGVHVHPTLIRWTRHLHGGARTCFVSDCVPAGETSGRWLPFGPLQVRNQEGACRLSDGSLAGGGSTLTHSYARWVAQEALATGTPPLKVLKDSLESITLAPLRALDLRPSHLQGRRVRWQRAKGGAYLPIPLRF